MQRLPAGARRPARALARRGGHREDVRAAGARVGVARLVQPPLHRRPGLVLRPARRLPDERPACSRRWRACRSPAAAVAARRRVTHRARGRDPPEEDADGDGHADKGLAPARARGHRRAAHARREDVHRPGPLALPQRRRRPDRPGAARARARDDERGDPQASSRGRAARPLRRQRRVHAALDRRGDGVARAEREIDGVGRAVRPRSRPSTRSLENSLAGRSRP